MLYLYDNAIVKDLKSSFTMDYSNIIVKAVEPSTSISIAAQLADDEISFPIICVVRDSDYTIDTDLTNFTAMHKGVPAVFDNTTNMIYMEKSIPIDIGYKICILCTNTADCDELSREIIFKYTHMYFLQMDLPYESERKMRFGIQIDASASIEKVSGVSQALSDGQLYEVDIPIKCFGVRLLSYTPVKLKNMNYETEVYSREQFNRLEE